MSRFETSIVLFVCALLIGMTNALSTPAPAITNSSSAASTELRTRQYESTDADYEYLGLEIVGYAIAGVGGFIAAWIGLKFVRANDLKNIRGMNLATATPDPEIEDDMADQIAMFQMRQVAKRRTQL